MNLFTQLEQSARNFPSRGALYVGERCVASFAELLDQARGLAAGLAQRYPRRSRIAIISENCADYLVLIYGVWAADMALVPINAKLHPREAQQILHDSQAAMAFVSPKLLDALRPLIGALPTVTVGAHHALMAQPSAARAAIDPADLAWLFYTSGTTGRSKGAMLSHRNLLQTCIAHLADIESVDENCSIIHAAPMSHGSGQLIAPYLSRGARQVIPASSGFDPIEFLDLCELHPSCGAFLAPTMVQRLRQAAEAAHRGRPKNLRLITYGGGPMYVEDLKKSIACFGQVFAQIYGQGETPMTITGLRQTDHHTDDDSILGSVGRVRSGVEVAVVDGDDRALPAGQIGEVVVRGEVVMSGYWDNPQATETTLRNGWLHTGDLASFDERGWLTLRDRSKDMIISGGSNIYPREVEEALLTHPAVGEACVVGQRDDEWGEIVVAFIVAAPGAALSATELDEHCLDRIARFKRPKFYHFVDTLPKNNYGKVLKRELRDRLARGAAD